MRKLAVMLAVLAPAGSAAALAADIPVQSKIEAVTVFPSGAEVTRTLAVKLEAGEHTLLVDGLAGETILSSIRIEAPASAKLETGSVDAKHISLSSTDPAVAQTARKHLEEKMQGLRDARAAQDDAIKAAQSQQTFLDNLSKLPDTQNTGSGAVPPAQWRELFGVIGTSRTEALKAIADAKLKQRELDRSIEDVQKELDAAAANNEKRTQIRIFVSAAAPVDAALALRYGVKTASWTPFYDARLATGEQGAASALTIARRATIQQKTGEDWDNVALSLSATRPGDSTSAPELRMLSVEYDPARPTEGKAAPTAGERAESPDYSRGMQWQVKDKSAQANVTAFQAVYNIPGRITIKSVSESKRLHIAAETVEPKLLVRTVPRLDSTAYLYTRITVPKTSTPVLAGQVALFRDGVFAGTGKFPQLAPGEEYELGFGADDRVKVKRVVLEQKSGEVGTFSTSFLDERRYAIAVKNLHTRPVQLQLIDRAPVSAQSDIKVEFAVDKGPQPAEKDLNGRRGTYMWQMEAAADEEKQIVFSYRVTAPSGKRLLYREPSEAELSLNPSMLR
jgi:uncharacterized protein (TIGR02231 family)